MSVFGDFGITESAFTALVFLYSSLFWVLALISALLFYVRGYGIYKMSRKLEIKGKWRGFVPFLNVWALGDLAAAGNAKRVVLKKIFTSFYLLYIIFSFAASVLSVSPLVSLLFEADFAVANGTDINPEIFTTFTLPFALIIISAVFCLIYRILRLACCYNIYKLFSEKYAVLFTVLSLFIPLLEAVFIYSVSSKEPFGKEEESFSESETGFRIYDEE